MSDEGAAAEPAFRRDRLRRDLRGHLLRSARGRRRAASPAPLRPRAARRRQHRGRHRRRLQRRTGCCCGGCGALRRPQRPPACGSHRLAPGRRLGLPLPVPLGGAGADPARLVLGAGEGTAFTPARPGSSTSRRSAARPGRRPLRPRVWASSRCRAIDRRAAPARLRLHLVWLFAGAMPGRGEIALRIPDPYRPPAWLEHEHQPLIAREAVRPGSALAMASVGYAPSPPSSSSTSTPAGSGTARPPSAPSRRWSC